YSGFTLPHRFGQSTETLSVWISDQVKGMAVSLPLGLILLELIYYLLRVAPQTWWLWVAAVLLVFQVLLANLAPILIMPLFNKYVPLGDEHADLAARLIRLAQRANTKVQGVYKFDMSRRTKSANAALTGLGNTRRIILGDTLITEFTPDEIETVLAHELGHQVHRDIPVGIAVETVITLVGLYLVSLLLEWGVAFFGLPGIADPSSLPLLMLGIGLYGVVTMPLGNAYSRWREHRADEYALQMTGNGLAFASALTRLANQNLAEVDPEAWVEVLFYSHPALGKRIRMAESADGKV
ncbi:MAG TPA: M48 family metallopeptidase, partial [Candidatus Acidoferrum sp.]|nr:M48 family metallopeptidase [Candidatus Acidoferrum sp.]